MKERPILFSGPMVRALLDGSKTQTRRVVKDSHAIPTKFRGQDDTGAILFDANYRCPYGESGDRLWVRETFLYVGPGSGSDLPSYREERSNPKNHKASSCWFRASQPDETLVWTPSIHMPRWASRITLEVTGVRVERLQSIREDDARFEGVTIEERHMNGYCAGEHYPPSIRAFRDLWDGLAAPGTDWDTNPWVWVVEFKRVT